MSGRFTRNSRVRRRALNRAQALFCPRVYSLAVSGLSVTTGVKPRREPRKIGRRFIPHSTNNVSAGFDLVTCSSTFLFAFLTPTPIVHASSRIYLPLSGPTIQPFAYVYRYVHVYTHTHTYVRYTCSTILSLGGAQKWRVFTIRWKHGAHEALRNDGVASVAFSSVPEKIRSRNKRNGEGRRGKKRTRKHEEEDEEEQENERRWRWWWWWYSRLGRRSEEKRTLGSEIICRYNRLPAGKKVKCEVPFAMRCYVDGVSLLIFNPLPAYLVRSERDL